MEEGIKRRRRLYPHETEFLLRVFEQYPRPTGPMREMIANQLGMSPRGVQIWFQNRRAKVKRDLMESGQAMLMFAPTTTVDIFGPVEEGSDGSSQATMESPPLADNVIHHHDYSYSLHSTQQLEDLFSPSTDLSDFLNL